MATSDINVVLDGIQKFANRVVIKAVLDVHANLVAKPEEGGTPIDTGWASSNWIPSIGAPADGPVGTRPTLKADINRKAIGDFSRQLVGEVDYGPQHAGVSSISGYRIDVDGNVYISNSVPYIGALNGGSSKQQPSGFIERAIVKAITEDIHH